MMMFPQKLDAELPDSVSTLLHVYASEAAKNGIYTNSTSERISARGMPLLQSVWEISDPKGKKWVRRFVQLYDLNISIHRGEEVRHPEADSVLTIQQAGEIYEKIPLENVKNISLDESQHDLMDVVRKIASGTLGKLAFAIRYVTEQQTARHVLFRVSKRNLSCWPILSID